MPIKGKVIDKKIGSYQTFEDQLGDSNSYEKLKRLRLPQSLAGKKVLDIGCNEGFFCIEAKRRGATKVIGVDIDKKVIERAKKRAEGIEGIYFINTTWWDLPDEKFDIILFLSTLHYEHERPKELLDYIATRLKEDGVLILECGVWPVTHAKHWVLVQRCDGVMRYPTMKLLIEDLLSKYAVSLKNQSINQPGDPVPRFVFHCSLKRPIYLFIRGRPGIGKTYLVSLLSRSNAPVYHLDGYFHFVKSQQYDRIKWSKVLTLIHEKCDLLKIDHFIDNLDKESLEELANNYILTIS